MIWIAITELCHALNHIHSSGIAHNDIKLDNVFIEKTKSSLAVVSDTCLDSSILFSVEEEEGGYTEEDKSDNNQDDFSQNTSDSEAKQFRFVLGDFGLAS